MEDQTFRVRSWKRNGARGARAWGLSPADPVQGNHRQRGHNLPLGLDSDRRAIGTGFQAEATGHRAATSPDHQMGRWRRRLNSTIQQLAGATARRSPTGTENMHTPGVDRQPAIELGGGFSGEPPNRVPFEIGDEHQGWVARPARLENLKAQNC